MSSGQPMKNMICPSYSDGIKHGREALEHWCTLPPPTHPPPSLTLDGFTPWLDSWLEVQGGCTFNGQSHCESEVWPWQPVRWLCVSLEPKLSVWPCWIADSRAGGRYSIITSACQQINVLLRVSSINLTTVCNCRECPHINVCSLGAYSRWMHVWGRGDTEKGEGHTKLPADQRVLYPCQQRSHRFICAAEQRWLMHAHLPSLWALELKQQRYTIFTALNITTLTGSHAMSTKGAQEVKSS